MCRRLNALASLALGNKHSQVQGRAKGEGKLFAEEGPPRLQGGPKTSRANEALQRHLREGRPTEVHEIKLPLHREKDTCSRVSKNRTHRGPEESDGLRGRGGGVMGGWGIGGRGWAEVIICQRNALQEDSTRDLGGNTC